MLRKSSIVILIILVLLNTAVSVWYIKQLKTENTETLQKIETLDKQIRQDESIIDSLEKVISLRESLIDSLSFFRQEKVVEKVIKIKEVRELPLTESVEFLREKIKEYEEIYEEYLLPSDTIIQ